MFKKIILSAAILLLLLASITGLIIWNLNSLIERIIPQLERAASQAIGAPVKFQQARATLFPEASLEISGLELAEDQHSKASFSLKNFRLIFSLKDLLKKKEIEISDLLVNSPNLTIVKDKNGKLWLPLLGAQNNQTASKKEEKKERKGKSEKPAIEESKEQPESVSSRSQIKVLIKKITVNNGKLTFVDHQKEETFYANDFYLKSLVSLEQDQLIASEIDLALQAITPEQFLSTPLKITIRKGGVHFNLKSNQLDFKDLILGMPFGEMNINGGLKIDQLKGEISLVSQGLSLESIKNIFSNQLKQYNPNGSLAPNIKILFDFGKKNFSLPKLSGDILLQDIGASFGEFNFNKIIGKISLNSTQNSQTVDLNNIKLKFNQEEVALKSLLTYSEPDQLNINNLLINLLGGEINCNGILNDLLTKASYRLKTKVLSLDIERTLSLLKPSLFLPISGSLAAFSGEFAGKINTNDPLAELSGEATMVLHNLTIKNFNLIGKTMESILILSNINDSLDSNTREILKNNNTNIDNLSAQALIKNKLINLTNLDLQSPLFELRGTGFVKIPDMLDLKNTITFSPLISAKLAEKIKELRYAFDDQNRLSLPLEITGSTSNPKITPKAEQIIKQAAKAALKKEAEKAIGKVLEKGGKKELLKGLGSAFGF
ncbi:MAG TPA: AsmA-like C-terminal region-containing protein [Oligoflexia bacterium]|nr:AsmA-like C-terminal region-containing protein [Oligoflexia bacterium]HMP26613.1 AsmA-like C-terminal region-containing protein [Oligoflexia bacterium]